MLSSLLFIGIIAILLVYIFHIKKELKHIATQLNDYNNKDMDTTISISLVDDEITLLAKNINTMILENKKTHIAILKHEENLKNSVVNISHDLRTPLTSIIGYLQILQSDRLYQYSPYEIETTKKANRYFL